MSASSRISLIEVKTDCVRLSPIYSRASVSTTGVVLICFGLCLHVRIVTLRLIC
jgi:hypothetical protein